MLLSSKKTARERWVISFPSQKEVREDDDVHSKKTEIDKQLSMNFKTHLEITFNLTILSHSVVDV